MISDYEVVINWIKAHVNHKGKEIADQATKAGSKLTQIDEIPVSYAFIKDSIKQDMYSEWDRRWQLQGDCRQTFLFFPCTDRGKR